MCNITQGIAYVLTTLDLTPTHCSFHRHQFINSWLSSLHLVFKGICIHFTAQRTLRNPSWHRSSLEGADTGSPLPYLETREQPERPLLEVDSTARRVRIKVVQSNSRNSHIPVPVTLSCSSQ